MTQSTQLQDKTIDELNVMKDDINVTSDEDAMTFYLPPDKLEEAETVLNQDLEVLEEYEHEYLVKADIQ